MIAIASNNHDIDVAPVARDAAAPVVLGEPRSDRATSGGNVPLSSLVTFVLWTMLMVVGLIGLLVEPARAVHPTAQLPVLQAELITVELAVESFTPPELQSLSPTIVGPPPMVPITVPDVARLAEVAAPDAPVAFALPVEGPVRIVAAGQAAPTRMNPSELAAAPPAVEAIEFGRGKGRQSAPAYPRQAQRERQEGRPGVRFAVDPAGRVTDVTLSAPSPWPLLNESALDTIRRKWRFAPADAGHYEVFIRFELRN